MADLSEKVARVLEEFENEEDRAWALFDELTEVEMVEVIGMWLRIVEEVMRERKMKDERRMFM